MAAARWDLTALLNAADPGATPVERHLWLIRLFEWLRSPGPRGASPEFESPADTPGTPWPVRRLLHLLNLLERHPEHRERVVGVLRHSLHGLDAAGLLADFGFAPRHGFISELGDRLRLAFLPGSPQTDDLGELFPLLLSDADDALWIAAIDDATLRRLLALCVDDPAGAPWQAALADAIQLLASQMRASAMAGAMRRRMDRSQLAQRPFHELAKTAEQLREAQRDTTEPGALVQQALYLRAVLAACRTTAASVRDHLDEHGISVDLVFQADQLGARADRIEALLACLVSPEPAAEWRRLVLDLARAGAERHGLKPLFTRHYALLARKVTERSAETGEHYITRDRGEYRAMLAQAAGGGAVIGLTTLAKFALAALALSAFWAGFWAGINYALSFVLVHLLHWTVATKQPAMTAPSMAARLEGVSASDEAVEAFVDEVAHLIRSQIAGIIGNLALVVPVVLGAQALAWWWAGAPLVGPDDAQPRPAFAAPARPHRRVRRLHRCAAVRVEPDRRLGRELVRLPPPGQRHRLEPRHHRPARVRPGRSAGRAGGAPTFPGWRPMCRWACCWAWCPPWVASSACRSRCAT